MLYTEKVMNLVKDSVSKIEQLTGQLKELETQYKADKITGQNYRERTAELEQQITGVRNQAVQDLQNIGTAYRAQVTKASEITGAMLHEDAKLLQLDMKMTPHQFEALVEKHKNNPLMAQLLQEYSNKHEGLYAGFIPTADAKASAFDQYIGNALNTVRTPDNLTSALFLDGKYTPVHCTETE